MMKQIYILTLFICYSYFGISQTTEEYYAPFYERISYPDSLKEQKVEGMVYLEYWIEKDGSITNQNVTKSVHPALTKIVLDASYFIKPIVYDLPEERYVRLKITLPINFKLD